MKVKARKSAIRKYNKEEMIQFYVEGMLRMPQPKNIKKYKRKCRSNKIDIYYL